MLQNRSRAWVVDNTGVSAIQCFWRRKGKSPRGVARVGDVVVGAVKEVRPGCTIRRGDVVHALIVRTRGSLPRVSKGRNTGRRRRFEDNAVILREPAGKGVLVPGSVSARARWVPKGDRVRGPVPRVLRQRGYGQVVSRAEDTV